MTRSTSEVAVCCSSDSRGSLQEPRVLDGDDGLGGEILDEIDLLLRERADFAAIDVNAPTNSPSLIIGTVKDERTPPFDPARDDRIALRIGSVKREVDDMNHVLRGTGARTGVTGRTEPGSRRERSSNAAGMLAPRGGKRRPPQRLNAELAPHSRVAFSSALSNTGCSRRVNWK